MRLHHPLLLRGHQRPTLVHGVGQFAVPRLDQPFVQALADRLAKSGVDAAPRGESLFVTDPDGRRFQIVPPDFKV